MTPRPVFLIVDGHSLAYRAFFAFPTTLKLNSTQFQRVLDFETSQGLIPPQIAEHGLIVNTIYGFMVLLLKTIEQFNPQSVCVCFDCKSPTFRHEHYEGYKAHRPQAPDDFIEQTPHLKRLLGIMGIPTIEKPGYEADDLIGTFTHQATAAGMDTCIMTGDHDALQLVSPQVSVVMGKQSELIIYTPEKVQEVYGLSPGQIVDYKALRGDTSDNIPGVKGIGEKTATQLLQTYGTLASIYAHLDEIKPPGAQEKLRVGVEMATLSKTLATIHCEVPVELDLSTCIYQPRWDLILEAFRRYEFRSLVQKYQKFFPDTPTSNLPLSINESAFTFPSVQFWPSPTWSPSVLSNGFSIVMDTQHSHQRQGLLPTSMGICAGESCVWEFPDTPEAWTQIAAALANPNIPKFSEDGKGLYRTLFQRGLSLNGLHTDVCLVAHLIDPLTPSTLPHAAELAHHSRLGDQLEQASVGEKAWGVWAIQSDLLMQLKTAQRISVYAQIELPLEPVLAKMECIGIALDVPLLNKMRFAFESQLHLLRQKCIAHVGFEFNLSSPKQLADVLFDHLKLPVIKKTKTGRSTDSSVLEKLKGQDPLIEWIMTLRQLEKLLSTYIIPLPTLVNPMTGRIHTTFNHITTSTGRLSSINPNLQNIPIRTKEGLDIRQAFVPSSTHHRLLSADYSQIELRVLAHLSQDPHMIEAFTQDEDIHRATASHVFQVPLAGVTSEQRYKAKAINFGIIYGISAFGLSAQLGISAKESQEIITHYFDKFPGIQAFIDTTLDQAREQGYVSTEFGRFRPIPDILSKNVQLRQFAERTAVNTRIQGTAAELMKMAMIRLSEALDKRNAQTHLVLQVHDELVLDVPLDEVDAMCGLVEHSMSGVVTWSVPLKVDISVGAHWKEISE